jgi:hypothetical protein
MAEISGLKAKTGVSVKKLDEIMPFVGCSLKLVVKFVTYITLYKH